MAYNPLEDEDFWRSQINSFQIDLPEKGLKAPSDETISDGYDLEMEGNLTEVRMNIYYFASPINGKYFMVNGSQKILDHGNMNLGEAFRKITMQRRRRR